MFTHSTAHTEFNMLNKRWLLYATLSLLGLICLTAASGAMLESGMRAMDRRDVPRSGHLVPITRGRRLHLDCRGNGSPTLVLESGLDSYGALAWTAVHDSLAQMTRTCAYSRAGVLWSDPATSDFSSDQVVRELHDALVHDGERAPWVAMGHSLGAAYALRFAHAYADEVRGLVLVDGSHPEQFARFREATHRSLQPSPTIPRIGALLAWSGALRLLPPGDMPHGWTDASYRAAQRFLPTSLAALASETDAIPATLRTMGADRSLRDLPLLVLAATKPLAPSELTAMGLTAEQGQRVREVSAALKRDQASWSSNSRLVEVPGAGHYVQFDRPDVVVREVRSFLEPLRAATRPVE